MPSTCRIALFFAGIILQIVAGWHFGGPYAAGAIFGFYLSLVLLIDGITRTVSHSIKTSVDLGGFYLSLALLIDGIKTSIDLDGH